MKPIFAFFARNHKLAHIFTIMIILLGLSALMKIKRDQYPTVDFGQIFITTHYPGAAPEDVELNVTNKIEEELKGVTGIKDLKSISMENISFIDVMIDPDVKNPDDVKDEIRTAVNRVTDFPVEVTSSPLITELNTSIFPIIEIGLTGDIPYADLREQARRFEKKLKSVNGVARVQSYGYLAREVKVEVSPDKMKEYQIALRDIIGAIKNRNIRSAGGSIESYVSEKNVVTMAQFRNPMEVGNVIVRSSFDGPSVKVKDLAIVNNGFEDERLISRMNGKSAISFIVDKSETADVIRTADAIKKLLKEEESGLPKGVSFVYSNDVSRYVGNQFDILKENGMIGLALVVVLLTLFLNIRAAFWVAAGIPVVLLGIIFLLPIFDSFVDSITLSALLIVLGIVVDDGIIVSENIFRRRELGDSPIDAAVNGINEVFKPVITTILTTILAFVPMFFMTGMMGKFVYVIPLTIMLALTISFFEVTIALPAHLIPSLKRIGTAKKDSTKKKGTFVFKEPFQWLLYKFLWFRYFIVVFFILLLMGSLWYAKSQMNFILFPSKGTDRFVIVLKLPTGTSLKATSDKVKKAERIIDALPKKELASYVTRIGGYGDLILIEGENYAMVNVSLTPFSERDRTADEIVEVLRERIEGLNIFEETRFEINTGGPPVGKPVTIRVVGSDDKLRKKLSKDLQAFLVSVDGVKDIDSDDKKGKEQVEIKIKYDKLAQLDLTVADVARNVRIAYDGEVVSNIRYGDEDVDFRVQLKSSARTSLKSLRNLVIPNRHGRLIPLKEVAYLKVGPGPAGFHHYDNERSTTITADIIQGQSSAIEVVDSVLKKFDLNKDYPGMRFIIGGEVQEQKSSMNDLFISFGIAVLGIYFLLILLFNSFLQPFIVLLAIPFGIAGVIIAFAFHSEPFSFLALIGTLGLSGIVVNDSLVLVSHVNELRKTSPGKKIKEIVAEGSADRLRAIVMTTLTTVAGLLPLAYGIGGTDVYMSPMALAIGYGLLFATPITLVLLPSLYVIGDDIKKLFSKKNIKENCVNVLRVK